MKKLIKKNKGITLIALVVTIIVLLILAGISISMLTGENGILKRAQEARQKTEISQKEEKNALASYEDYANEYATNIKVEQVIDKKPGVLEVDGTDTNSYTINSIEDLVFFSYDVTNGNTYKGKTVKLGLSLDFNSSKSYVDAFRTDYGKYGYNGELKTLLTSGSGFRPIGTTSNIDTALYSFAGTFDGNNNKIIGLYINDVQIPTEEKRIGLFGHNYGIIQNVGIVNSNISLLQNGVTCDVGGIVAKNYNTINNCYYIGSMSLTAENSTTGLVRIGGITSGNDLEVNNCYHKGNINIYNNGVSSSFAGGIVAGNQLNITGCHSSGNIKAVMGSKNSSIGIGGICGLNSSKIKNCYSRKNIDVNNTNAPASIGGITGESRSISEIAYCYNIGILTTNAHNNNHVGSFVGDLFTSSVKNCYFLKGTANKGIGVNSSGKEELVLEKTEDEMKQIDFVNLLNQGNLNNWSKDINNINNGYPILNWQ